MTNVHATAVAKTKRGSGTGNENTNEILGEKGVERAYTITFRACVSRETK